MKITKIIFDGTPEEYEKIAHLIGKDDGDAPPTKEAIREMLNRIKIPNGQRILYKALLNAGDKGLNQIELSEQLDRTLHELSGILGALGHRINKTLGLEGKGGLSVVLDTKKEEKYVRYFMKDLLRDVLLEDNIL